MRNPFASRATTPEQAAAPSDRIEARARAAQARDAAERRRSARGSGDAARTALTAQLDDDEARLEAALAVVGRFSPSTLELLAAELDADDPVTRYSPLGRAASVDAALPGWLRDRVLRDRAPRGDAEAVVLDWLAFGAVFVAHKEFSARPADDPLPQLYGALSLSPGMQGVDDASESIAVAGVATAGRGACERIIHVALALRGEQRAAAARAAGAATGYAAADALRAFDRSHRFVTAELAEWIVDREPGDAEIAAAVASGRFSHDGLDAEGRATGIAPHDIDEAAFVAELGRTRARR